MQPLTVRTVAIFRKPIIHAVIPVYRLVTGISLTTIPGWLAADEKELTLLRAYPVVRLAKIVQEIGFSCTCCAQCCTRAFNGYVFLLDEDTTKVKEIEPAALEPAPGYDFCDQHGIFYVSGYALRAQGDKPGSCWFLDGNRCRIYERRPSICRVYPHMLHREPDDAGAVDWRQVADPDRHGEYHAEVSPAECMAVAREIRAYEEAVLMHEIAFLRYMQEYFQSNRLRHVQKRFDDRMRAHARGEPVTVRVFYRGTLEEVMVTGSGCDR